MHQRVNGCHNRRHGTGGDRKNNVFPLSILHFSLKSKKTGAGIMNFWRRSSQLSHPNPVGRWIKPFPFDADSSWFVVLPAVNCRNMNMLPHNLCQDLCAWVGRSQKHQTPSLVCMCERHKRREKNAGTGGGGIQLRAERNDERNDLFFSSVSFLFLCEMSETNLHQLNDRNWIPASRTRETRIFLAAFMRQGWWTLVPCSAVHLLPAFPLFSNPVFHSGIQEDNLKRSSVDESYEQKTN